MFRSLARRPSKRPGNLDLRSSIVNCSRSILCLLSDIGTCQCTSLFKCQAQLVRAIQSAGCNAKHELEQRLARWLLICADRAHSDTFKMSQEYLAEMLGASRPTVSTTAGLLKEAKLIEYTRGWIHILDVPGLEKKVCECYHIIKDHLDNYAEFESGITA